MTTKTQFITPGLDDTRAAYEGIRALDVDPHSAADWIASHVRELVRNDLAAQIARPVRRTVPTEVAPDPIDRKVRRALQVAVKVYNRSRPRLTIIEDTATQSGAAAVNRAAVLRQIHTPGEGPAVLGRQDARPIRLQKTITGWEVAARLHIPGGTVRAVTATFQSTSNTGAVRLSDFRVILPGQITH